MAWNNVITRAAWAALVLALGLPSSEVGAQSFEGRIEGQAKLWLATLGAQTDAIHSDVALHDGCFAATDQDGAQFQGTYSEVRRSGRKRLVFEFDPDARAAMQETVALWARELLLAEEGIDSEVQVSFDSFKVSGRLNRRRMGLTAVLNLRFTATAPALGTSRRGRYTATLRGSGGPASEDVCPNAIEDAPTLRVPPNSSGHFAAELSYAWPVIVTNQDRYELEESTSSPTSGFSVAYRWVGHDSPHIVDLERPPGTYYYRARVYNGLDPSPYSEVAQHVVTPASRTLLLENYASPGRNLDAVVQLKVARAYEGVFSRADLLSDDSRGCQPLPGEEIPIGGSRRVQIAESDYFVFIGFGTWEPNLVTCPPSARWSKRTFFTDPGYRIHYVWTVIQVSGHDAGEAVWTLTGDYLGDTLAVTPEGLPSIPFQRTTWDPIP